jgi:hypothetical protein
MEEGKKEMPSSSEDDDGIEEQHADTYIAI